MNNQLKVLMDRYVAGNISEEDFLLLRQLLMQNSDEELEEQLVDLWYNQKNELSPAEQRKGIVLANLKEGMWKSIDRQIGESSEEEEPTHRMAWRKYLFRIAATVLLLLATGGSFWYKQYTKVTPPAISEGVRMAMQESKEQNPQTLTVSLASEDKQQLRSTLARYCKDEEVLDEFTDAFKMTTVEKKDGWLTLDDGTVVHLNGNSRLFFPEHFGRVGRDVILDGEAYFMVAKDKSRPFVVHTAQGDVREYGTEFNVAAHSGKATEVVLVEGSIGVTPVGGTEQMMRPNMMCRVEGSTVVMNVVDTEPYKAWNVGKFTFQNWQMERIMNVLSRWYGMPVEYTDPSLRHLQLSGTFNRYDGMAETMEALGAVTGTQITIENGKIIINNIKF